MAGYRNHRSRRLWLCLALMGALGAVAEAGPFQVAAALRPTEVEAGQAATLTVTFTIADKHYLYADQTTVSPAAGEGIAFGPIRKPSAISKRDPYLGNVAIYKAKAEFIVPVVVGADVAPGPQSIAIAVAYQGCTDTACFPPKREQLVVNFAVKAAPPPKLDSHAAEKPAQAVSVSPFAVRAEAMPEQVAPGGALAVRVTFDIAAKHYLHAKLTTVKPQPAAGLAFGQVKAPPSEEKVDPYLGAMQIYAGQAAFELPVTVDPAAAPGSRTLTVVASYQGCSPTSCFPPEEKRLQVRFVVAEAAAVATAAPTQPSPRQSAKPAATQQTDVLKRAAARFGLIGILALAFVWGIGASLTPCVYPMIPVTVSVIGASKAGSAFRAFLLSVVYVLGMSVTYAILGVVAALGGGLFGAYAQQPAVRLAVAAVFTALGISMFDVFYIQMPASVQSKLGGSKGLGVLGVLVTGAAAGAVVGPCVGPMLVGLLIYIATLGSKLIGFLTMWSFALGMGMLFLVIGTFSGAAASMPKAGTWMERVKRVFGVVMLAAALYYVIPLLPKNDLLWVLGLALAGMGAFAGVFKPLPMAATGRDRLVKALAIVSLTLGVGCVAKFGLDWRKQQAPTRPGIAWVRDASAGLTLARQQGKPAMMDFRADWCSSCLKLDHETFTNAKVIEASKRFVCIQVDRTDVNDALGKHLEATYGVVGLPTIVFVDSKGRFLAGQSITEFVGADRLLARMAKVNH